MTLDPGYFDRMYASSEDPWGFTSRWYEQRKYALTLAMLPAPRYQRAFEAGCSIGVLTESLAPRCERLLACDAAGAAVESAAARLRGCAHVQVQRRVLPADWPPGEFDLVVFSEVLYYFSPGDLGVLLDRAAGALRPGGTLLAVHWRHPVADYPQGGDEVHAALAAQPGLARLARHEEADFLAEAYLRAAEPAPSVAQAAGLA